VHRVKQLCEAVIEHQDSLPPRICCCPPLTL